MPVRLEVSTVRRAIWQQAGSATDGSPSTSVLGRMFHRALAGLIGAPGGDPDLRMDAVLSELEPDLKIWQEALIQHSYRRLFFPQFAGNPQGLATQTAALLDCWIALQHACRWLCELRWEWREHAAVPADWLLAERPVSYTLRKPDGSDAIELVGTLDGLVRLPHGPWCVLEFKLGKGAPEADLAQACLYHWLLRREGVLVPARSVGAMDRDASSADRNALSLVRFSPAKEEKLFNGAELETAQQRLIELVEGLAGVKSPPILPVQQPPVRKGGPTIVDSDAIQEVGRRLIQACHEYGVKVELDGVPQIGPAIVRYRLRLGLAQRLGQVTRLAPELQVKLGLSCEPFVEVQDGCLVADVQRPVRQEVLFAEVVNQFRPRDTLVGSALVPLGVDLHGRLEFIDLSVPASPHVLVAGSAGSGKSEWLISALAGLTHANSPDTLQLTLIDPKRNAFTWLTGSTCLRRPIACTVDESIEVLDELIDEQEARYVRFAAAGGAPDLAEFVRRTGEPMPRIVCMCDEYADLVNAGAKERKAFEGRIKRLGAKARAAGIHLILATQQPSRQVVSGPIKTNCGARVGLRTAEAVESRMLLDEAGAEKLLGSGDLLYKCIGASRRLQGLYVTPSDRNRLISQPR